MKGVLRVGIPVAGLLMAALPPAVRDAMAQDPDLVLEQDEAPAFDGAIDLDGIVQLNEILVTARKFEEDIQRVPFSLSVIDEQEIEDYRVGDSERLFRDIPNFAYSRGINAFGQDFAVIRGVGGYQTLSPDDTSVSYHIDGIPIPFGTIDAPFQDLSRIEVLRGPQGTLFGRNAQAGAVNLVTADPTDRPEASGTLEYGELGFNTISAVASGPISPTFGVRASFAHQGRDGFIRDRLGVNEDLGAEDITVGAFKAVADVGDRTTVKFTARGGREERDADFAAIREGDGFPIAEVDVESTAVRKGFGAGMIIEHAISDSMTFVSSTGYSGYGTDILRDSNEGISAPVFFPPFLGPFDDPTDFLRIDERLDQYFQEFRVDGETAGGTVFTTGLSYLYSDYHLDQVSLFPVLFAFDGMQDNTLTTTSCRIRRSDHAGPDRPASADARRPRHARREGARRFLRQSPAGPCRRLSGRKPLRGPGGVLRSAHRPRRAHL